MKILFKLAIILNCLFMASCSTDNPITVVSVEGGKVEGIVQDSITIFKGIPFAQPPVGDLRWKAPQPVKNWEGILKADKFAPACPQMTFAGMKPVEQSEDCLYLNVWSPAKSSSEKLPVMVWIYGGGFALGSTSAPVYSGEQIAKLGVVFVSVAYRLGPLGFMAHPELTAESPEKISGNYGLLDQIQGLKWVQKNIRAFGGDPDKVTIFGESAGAESVSMLSASPLTKGLFSGAISESGGSFSPVKNNREADCMQLMKGAEQAGIDFMKRMGASSISELRKMQPEKWANDPMSQMGGFWPVVDGYVITDDQYKLYEQGKYNDVNVIIGTNSDEGSMFARPFPPEQFIKSANLRFGPVAEKILKLYPLDSLTGTYRPLADIFQDAVFAWPSWSWANLQSKTGKSRVFVYYFDQWRPEPMYQGAPMPVGAAHASELPYVFGHLGQNTDLKPSDDEKKLSDIIIRYWTNFAKTGDPNGTGLPTWPIYTENKKTVMHLKGTTDLIDVPNIERLKALDEYFTWKRNSDQKAGI